MKFITWIIVFYTQTSYSAAKLLKRIYENSNMWFYNKIFLDMYSQHFPLNNYNLYSSGHKIPSPRASAIACVGAETN